MYATIVIHSTTNITIIFSKSSYFLVFLLFYKVFKLLVINVLQINFLALQPIFSYSVVNFLSVKVLQMRRL